MKRLTVGIAGLEIAGPDTVLVTLGLGSCVAVAIRDDREKRGSMVHIMLPSQSYGKRRPGEKMNKYADIAIPEAIRGLEELGCRKENMSAKIAGGSCMFNVGREDQINIGRRNVDSVKRILETVDIPLVAEDTGGSNGRTVEFHIESGLLIIKTVSGGERSL